MRDIPIITFGGYRLFVAGEHHFDLAKEWTEADPHHRGVVSPAFWLLQGPGIESYLLADDEGPIYFVRLQRTFHECLELCKVGSAKPQRARTYPALELHLQFAPCQPSRTALALKYGLEWLIETLKDSGIALMRFESRNSALMKFSQERLGFAILGNTLVKWLIAP